MPTVHEIERALFQWAPKDLAQSWDNVGLLVGEPDQEVRRVLYLWTSPRRWPGRRRRMTASSSPPTTR